jgi:hypothetical protein
MAPGRFPQWGALEGVAASKIRRATQRVRRRASAISRATSSDKSVARHQTSTATVQPASIRHEEPRPPVPNVVRMRFWNRQAGILSASLSRLAGQWQLVSCSP